jgi:hypothetical protein
MMLFASSNKLKLENMHEEVSEIQKGYHEVIETSEDQKVMLDSVNGLSSRLDVLNDEIDAVLYRYAKISEMLNQIDIMISDYYEMDIEIDLYELNGMESDLLGIKDEYKKWNTLKFNIDGLKKEMDNNK